MLFSDLKPSSPLSKSAWKLQKLARQEASLALTVHSALGVPGSPNPFVEGVVASLTAALPFLSSQASSPRKAVRQSAPVGFLTAGNLVTAASSSSRTILFACRHIHSRYMPLHLLFLLLNLFSSRAVDAAISSLNLMTYAGLFVMFLFRR